MGSFFSLKDKLALITGSGRGIGKSLSLALAKSGSDIILTSRSEDELRKVQSQINAIGRKCDYFCLDVSKIKDIKKFYSKLNGLKLYPDILINNAGTEEVRSSEKVDEKLWDKILDTNLKGAFFSSQCFASQLKKNNKSGSIINLGSLSSSIGIPALDEVYATAVGIPIDELKDPRLIILPDLLFFFN
jgi:gluconate 5-dehydrogenase